MLPRRRQMMQLQSYVAHLFPRGPFTAVGDVVGDGSREQYGFLSQRNGGGGGGQEVGTSGKRF